MIIFTIMLWVIGGLFTNGLFDPKEKNPVLITVIMRVIVFIFWPYWIGICIGGIFDLKGWR